MKFRNTLILLIVVIILFGLVYFLELRKPDKPEGKSRNLGEILAVEQDEIKGIELSYSDPNYQTIVCSKSSEGKWMIEKPLQAKADQREIQRLISNPLEKLIQNTIESPENLSEYGLDNPRVNIKFTLTNNESINIMLGDTVPTGNYAYVKKGSQPEIHLSPANIVDDMTKFVSDLRDRTVIEITPADIQRIKFISPRKQDIECEKIDTEWYIKKPFKAKADSGKIDGIISAIRNLEIKSFVSEDDSDLSEYSLNMPKMEIQIYIKEGVTKSLMLGEKKFDGVYAKTKENKSVYLVDADILKQLENIPEYLRDKTLLSFDIKAAEKINIIKNDPLTLEKKMDGGDEYWELTRPIITKADKKIVEEILLTLSDLESEELVSDDTDDLSEYGLENPGIQIVVSVAGLGEDMVLSIGDKRGDSAYITSSYSKGIYLLDMEVIDNIARDFVDLQDKQVISFNRDDVKRLKIKRQDMTIVCIKQERDWRIIEPIKEKANNYKIIDILREMEEMKATRFLVSSVPKSSVYGLDNPAIEVKLIFEDGTTKVLLIGKELENRESVYAMTDSGFSVFVLDTDNLKIFMQDLDELIE
ncbi:DUF4340 domain-containing protein [Candidatus Poribacteria bacterium]|nr:DUF4340 domain-containing protein [Candidatus Poribacteria bacterium]